MLRFFYWPAVGSAITEERSKPVENDALSKAGTKINQIIRELRATADHNQTMYHDIFLNMLAIQRELEDTLKLLQKAEHPE